MDLAHLNELIQMTCKDQGKGFSIVASEVKKLVEQTKAAKTEIDKLIAAFDKPKVEQEIKSLKGFINACQKIGRPN
jgi:hypothetical protein